MALGAFAIDPVFWGHVADTGRIVNAKFSRYSHWMSEVERTSVQASRYGIGICDSSETGNGHCSWRKLQQNTEVC